MSDWFYMKGANKHGPVSASKLRELAQSGELLASDLVWKEGMGDWKRARKIDGLFDGKSPAVQPANSTPSSPASTSVKKRPPAPPGNLLENGEIPKQLSTRPATNGKPAAWSAPVTQPTASNPPPIAAPAGPDGILHCPFCEGEMSDDPSSAGQEVSCPHCGRHFRMPTRPTQPFTWTAPQVVTAVNPQQTIAAASTGMFTRKIARKVQRDVIASVTGLGVVVALIAVYMVVGALTPDGGNLKIQNPLKIDGDNLKIQNPLKPKPQGPTIAISAAKLFHAYDQNELLADEKYKDKRLRITGIADDISKGLFGEDFFITLHVAPYSVFHIQCFFEEKYQNQAKKVVPGQKLEIIGVCSGKLGNVLIKDCTFAGNE